MPRRQQKSKRQPKRQSTQRRKPHARRQKQLNKPKPRPKPKAKPAQHKKAPTKAVPLENTDQANVIMDIDKVSKDVHQDQSITFVYQLPNNSQSTSTQDAGESSTTSAPLSEVNQKQPVAGTTQENANENLPINPIQRCTNKKPRRRWKISFKAFKRRK